VDSVRAKLLAAGGARPLPTAVPRRFGASLFCCLHNKFVHTWAASAFTARVWRDEANWAARKLMRDAGAT
jgi:hypothetical protein